MKRVFVLLFLFCSCASWAQQDAYTVLQMHFDNLGNSAIATDTSAWKNLGSTLSGTATGSSVQAKWGNSLLIGSGTNNRINLNNGGLYDLGDRDFTVEFWTYPPSLVNSTEHLVTRTNASPYSGFSLFKAFGNVVLYATSNGSSWNLVNGETIGTFTVNTWQHMALTRTGGYMYFWKDGQQTWKKAVSGSLYRLNDPSNALWVGGSETTNQSYCGYIDELRISNGICRYTATFSGSLQSAPYSDATQSATITTVTGGLILGSGSVYFGGS